MITFDAELTALGLPLATEPAVAPLAAVTEATQHPAAAQWARWKPRFAEAMEGGFNTIEALEQKLFQNRVQFWPGEKSALVTEIVNYEGGERCIQALWAAGDMDDLDALTPGVEAFARLMGCTSALIEGRRGWLRRLKDRGYREWSTTLRKAL